MNKYQFLQDRQKNPIILYYGELGACQLLCHKQTKQLCVLKLAPKSQILKDIQCLSQMTHPNIIKIINHYNHEENTLVIFQLLAGGDLYTKIKCGEIKRYMVPAIFRGICLAIQYIHSRKIIHRNLKTQTILLDSNFNPKIVDFGLAARLTTRKTFCGCYYYMAPEILRNQEYNQKVDVWALGVILYEMMYGQVPFSGENSFEVMKHIENSKYYQKNYEVGSYDQLIRSMICLKPTNRPTVKTILEHPLLKVQPLSFLHIGVKSLSQNHRSQVKSQGTKRSLNRTIQSKSKLRKNTEITQKTTNKSTATCPNIRKLIENKIMAIRDSQKIKYNPEYNFVVNP